MRRRDFLGFFGGAAIWPQTVQGQQLARTPHVGVLLASEQNDEDLQARLGGLRQGLERLGWLDGRTIRMTYRFGEGKPERFQMLAKELVVSQPDIIIAQTPPVVAAVRRETSTISTVFVDVSDPVGPGFIATLARPGGNLTGMISYEPGVVGKWLGMLKEFVPGLTRAAVITNPKTTASDYWLRSAAAHAPSLGIEVVLGRVETADDIARTFEALASVPNSGLVFPPDATTILHRDLVVGLAARHRLPAVYPFRLFVEVGGLMCYSLDFIFQYRLAASYVDRILRGAKPGDIPVQTPTKFHTALNLKTAKSLGLAVPAGLLVAADEVIE